MSHARPKPHLTILSLVAADLAAVVCSIILAYALAVITGGSFPPGVYLAFFPRILVITALLYALLGLYPGILLPLPEEIKRLCIANITSILIFTATFFISRSSDAYSRKFLILLGISLLVLVPVARTMVRERFRRFPWWGHPVIIFGNERKNREILADLKGNMSSGLKPVAVVRARIEEGESQAELEGVENCILNLPPHNELDNQPNNEAPAEASKLLQGLAQKYPGAIAVIAMSGFNRDEQNSLPSFLSAAFHKVVIIPSAAWTVRLSLRMVETGSMLALGMRHNLLDPNRLRFKRCFDFIGAFLGLLLLFPVFLGCAIAIRCTSKGPAFYRQNRIGQHGKPIRVFKFRTMVANADEVLKRHLEENPGLREEWDATQKLRHDPRITKVGHFLRKTSLDELPQLLNVLGGSMSLVGPRPIVQSEIAKYAKAFAEYARVRPGITGLWQVSGRSNTTYAHRVQLDQYYIFNWSVWLDLYILLRTIPAVLRQSGAY